MDKVRIINDPILRAKARPVMADDPTLHDLIKRMIEVMKAENGVGLAANQIGDDRAVFVTDLDGVVKEWINPEMICIGHDIPFEEGCLSVPGAQSHTVRNSQIKISYTDLAGIQYTEILEGLIAVVCQHEYDHLNGKLYVDQLSSLKRSMVLSKHAKFMKFRGGI